MYICKVVKYASVEAKGSAKIYWRGYQMGIDPKELEEIVARTEKDMTSLALTNSRLEGIHENLNAPDGDFGAAINALEDAILSLDAALSCLRLKYQPLAQGTVLSS
jgi:hypothetical protein